MAAHRKNKVKLVWTDNFAYVIGVIATDGNLSPDLRHIHITSKDYEMVINSKKCLGIDNKIGKKSRGGELDKKYYVLQFGDINFFEFLLEIGLTPNKSKTLGKLLVPDEFFSHFFRGCIDGDGSLTKSKHPESRHPQYTIRLCSASKKFLEWILTSCQKLFALKGGSILEMYGSSVYTLRFGKEDSVKILKIIYSKDVVCLSRKRTIALEMLNGQVAELV